MKQITISVRNPELSFTQEDLGKVSEIMEALLNSGGLTGVKGGKTILHFDADGIFMGVELDYWPWRRRKKVL